MALRGLTGTYRLYAWSNGRATPYANELDSRTERHSGFGFSVDQQVAQHLILDFGFTLSGVERQVELFYSWQVNDNFRLSPSLQWISRPGGDGSVDSITILALRAKADF